jgi:hypothetical protein
MEAWKLHVWTIIVSEAFINNWADFLFVETSRDGGHWQITSFPAGITAQVGYYATDRVFVWRIF